jgi:hypothetical protein
MIGPETKERARALERWHPATKLLVAVGLVAIPYLAWTSLGEAPAAVTVSQRPAVAVAPAVASPQVPGEVTLARLPPVEQFTAMVERPLFSPSRRPGMAPEAELAGAELQGPEPEPAAEVSGLPEVRFVGTIGQGGAMTALVVPEGHHDAVKLRVGDEVAGWRVHSVTASQLVIEQDGERLVLTILE